LKIINFLRIT